MTDDGYRKRGPASVAKGFFRSLIVVTGYMSISFTITIPSQYSNPLLRQRVSPWRLKIVAFRDGTFYLKGCGHRDEHCRISGSPYDSIGTLKTANTNNAKTNRVYYFCSFLTPIFAPPLLRVSATNKWCRRTLTLTKPQELSTKVCYY